MEGHSAACALDKKLVRVAAARIAFLVDPDTLEQQHRPCLADRVRQLDVVRLGTVEVDVEDDQLGVALGQLLEEAGINRSRNVIDVDRFLQKLLGALR